jgi:hypothetical protein
MTVEEVVRDASFWRRKGASVFFGRVACSSSQQEQNKNDVIKMM